MKIEIIGEDITLPTVNAQRLFTDLGLPELLVTALHEGEPTRADPFTVAVGISSILLMLPPAIDATINLIDRARRDTARKGVDDLKAALEAAGAESVITTSNGRTLILPKAATDEIVDAILAALAERQSETDTR